MQLEANKMQNTEQLMSYQDLLNLANELAIKINEPVIKKLQEVEEKLNNLANKEDEKPEKLVLANAKEIGEHIGVSTWQARGLMRHPNFPKPITKRTGKYNRGQWRAEEIERFFRINKGKI